MELNFRDLAGLPTAGGKRLRSEIFFRSEGPKNFTQEGLTRLGALPIGTIIDLRSEGERNDHPHTWHSNEARLLACDMNNDLRTAGETEWERLRTDNDPQAAIAVMSQNYRAMPSALHSYWPAIFNSILQQRNAIFVNCTAGKDRTGTAVALLLSLLEVETDAILTDYLKSGIFAKNMAMAGLIEKGFQDSCGFVPHQVAIDALLCVNEAYLEAALDEMHRQWGSIDDYFSDAGITADMQDEARKIFVAD